MTIKNTEKMINELLSNTVIQFIHGTNNDIFIIFNIFTIF